MMVHFVFPFHHCKRQMGKNYDNFFHLPFLPPSAPLMPLLFPDVFSFLL